MSGLSAEDRARLEGLLDYLQRTEDHPQAKADVDVFARALALIDQQEEALRAAAWPLHAMGPGHPDLPDWARKQVGWIQQLQTRADQQEKALEAADAILTIWDRDLPDTYGADGLDEAFDAYRSARAASTKEEG